MHGRPDRGQGRYHTLNFLLCGTQAKRQIPSQCTAHSVICALFSNWVSNGTHHCRMTRPHDTCALLLMYSNPHVTLLHAPVSKDCWWRVVAKTAQKNSTCVNGKVADAVTAKRPACFTACGPGKRQYTLHSPYAPNRTVPCHFHCCHRHVNFSTS